MTAPRWCTAFASPDANHYLDRFAEALRCAEEALAIAERVGDTWATAFAVMQVAAASREMGELGRAAAAADTLMELAETLDDQFFMQSAYWCRGIVGVHRSDPSGAEALAAARQLAERTHDEVNLGDICGWQGALSIALGHEEEGCRILEEAIPVSDAYRPATGARIRCLLAEAAVRALTWPRPGVGWTTPWRCRWPVKWRWRQERKHAWRGPEETIIGPGASPTRASCRHVVPAALLVVDFLELLALLSAGTERYIEAGRLLGALARERERLGYARSAAEQPEVDLEIGRIEAALGPSRFAAAWSEGASLSVDEAVRYARRGRGRRGRPSTGWASLTPTERMVVELVADRLTNAEIGERMFVSTATVKSHVSHIFDKLGVTNRRQLTGAAREVIV